MAHVSLSVTEEEQFAMENYAKLQGLNISEAIKNVFFQWLEDEFDLQQIRTHREMKAKGGVKLYTLDEIEHELGLHDV